ncbi:glycosyltransferase [Sphingobacterium thalpophilum]|uniref:Chondroitin polymerase n=1 Tax=Sphingobacterium thalpophilum TaxID=259 RepID=A0A4U9V3A3_9SPHI|nr:glycosyltransferase [Sphingobacterium thalpophilum]VTR40057.1 Chondroitin polymerase [Sphingobacterium thalpophilum]
MFQKDLVSIVIPAYNVESTVIETLQSVTNQLYKKLEVIVVDDGSKDKTYSVIEEFAQHHSNIKIFSKANEGLPATRNYGFHFVTGEYLLFLDADDLLDKSYVSSCVEKFTEDNSLDIVYTQTQFFERETGIFNLDEYSKETILRTNCFTATAMMKSENFKAIGLYDTNLKFAEDWEMWIRMTQRFDHVYKIPKPLFYYRKRHSNDSMTDQNWRANISDEATLYIYIKHYSLFKEFNYGIERLLERVSSEERYKKKYYNIWYKKLFYYFKRKK